MGGTSKARFNAFDKSVSANCSSTSDDGADTFCVPVGSVFSSGESGLELVDAAGPLPGIVRHSLAPSESRDLFMASLSSKYGYEPGAIYTLAGMIILYRRY
jgi:hypothetical protein